MNRILAAMLALSLLGACSLLPDQIDETKGWSAAKLYTTAKEQLEEGDYTQAIQFFEKLEARYPYGPYAQQAQLEVAYAYYKDNEPVSAVAACDRFIKLHPNHPNVDYAYYLKGLANFIEDKTLLAGLANQDMSDRDPVATRESFQSFKELSTLFPNSKYTPDALARMKYLINALATHEVNVAKFYYKRGAYVAAANRGKHVLQHYQQAPALEDAVKIMVKSYDKLGLTDLRDDAKRVLDKNFPKSAGLDVDAAQKETSWWQFW